METTKPIKEPGEIIRREDFLPPDLKELAQLNEALPIGYGQTISQPLVVGFMLELLEPKEGQRILDIGAGSGWTTALLANIVGKRGRVIALEVIPELVEFGKNNVAKYNFIEKGIVTYVCQDGSAGYALQAPFDGILVSASLPRRQAGLPAKELPEAWKEQLKIGGRIVVPIQNSIWVFTKKNEQEFTEKEYPGFVFVPFVS